MNMIEGKDYLYNGNITTMSGPNTLKQIKGVMLCTKKYLFVVPEQTTSQFVVLTTFKNHSYFANDTVNGGCRKLISEANSVEELENTFINLLENDSKFVHLHSDKSSIKISKLFRTYTLIERKDKIHWIGCIIKGNEGGKALKDFYQDLLRK